MHVVVPGRCRSPVPSLVYVPEIWNRKPEICRYNCSSRNRLDFYAVILDYFCDSEARFVAMQNHISCLGMVSYSFNLILLILLFQQTYECLEISVYVCTHHNTYLLKFNNFQTMCHEWA